MSLIGKNIKKIRGVKKLSQTAFAELFGLSRTSVGAYEEERAEPKIDTLILIANHFGVSIDHLLAKDMTINEILHFDKFAEPFLENKEEKKEVLVTYSKPIIDLADVKNYLKQGGDSGYLNKLDQFYLSSIGIKDFSIFKLDKSFEKLGLVKGMLLVANQVSSSEGLKIFFHKSTYTISDLSLEDQEDVWSVKKIINITEPQKTNLSSRISTLESKMDEIMKNLK